MSTNAFLLSFMVMLPVTSGYITSGLPSHTHRAWLKKMTCDITESAPGDLTPEMLDLAPELMNVWAANPYINRKQKKEQKKKGNRKPNGTVTLKTNRIKTNVGASYKIDSTSSFNKCSSLSSDTPWNPVRDEHGRECALEVEGLLKRLIDERRAGNSMAIATTEAYNAVMDGWARSGEGGDAARRVDEILSEMQDMYEAGDTTVQPNLHSFKAALLAWSRACPKTNWSSPKHPRNSKKDKIPHAALRAQYILGWMIELSQSGRNVLATPDAECFDIVMHGWASSNHPDAPRRSEEVLSMMSSLHESGVEECKPRALSFNQVLSAWSKCPRNGSAKRAQDILDHMEKMAEAAEEHGVDERDIVRPNIASYSAVTLAWARSGERNFARNAEAILRRLEDAYLNEKDALISTDNDEDRLRPDTVMYNVVIDTWAKSKERGAYQRARAVLKRQTKLYQQEGLKSCQPDVYGYTSVLKACASAASTNPSSPTMKTERMKAFDTAKTTWEELVECDHSRPNHVTYGTMFKAIASLLPKNHGLRKIWAKNLFRQCCEDGCVGEMALNRFREAASGTDLYKVMMDGATKATLPAEWTCKLPADERRERRKAKRRVTRRMEV